MRLIINTTKLNLINDAYVELNLPHNIVVEEFHIVNAIIPYSFYNINNNGNSFQINSTTYTLINQNYNIYQLVQAINTLIVGTGVNVVYNRQSLKLILTKATSFTFNPLKLGTILGFDDNTIYTGTSITSPYSIDITNNIRNVYIKSNIAPADNIIENEILGNGILYRVPITCNFGELIHYVNLTNNLNTPINQIVKKIQIELTDSNFNRLDLNGLSFQMEFFIKTADDKMLLDAIYKQAMSEVDGESNPNKSTLHPYDFLFK